MRLTSFSYSEFLNDPYEWAFDPITFEQANLIVGKNATGKTRILNVIGALSRLVSGALKEMYLSGSYTAEFDTTAGKSKYCLEIENKRIVKETYEVNGEVKLYRPRGGVGRIEMADVDGASKTLKVQVPEDLVAAAVRRDKIQHPFLEGLHTWASAVRQVRFGSEMGHKSYMLIVDEKSASMDPTVRTLENVDDRDPDHVAAMFRAAQVQFPDAFEKEIIRDMIGIGYDIESIGLERPTRIVWEGPQLDIKNLLGLYVKERGLRMNTQQSVMSQGMFRVLSLLIHINYDILTNRPACILIDDIGEGLDFERSCALIDTLRSKTKGSEVQLLMSTNDRFVMNRIPLEEWIVLRREGQKVLSNTYRNSREAFEQFKLTGLNNFDFFTTNFVAGPTSNG